MLRSRRFAALAAASLSHFGLALSSAPPARAQPLPSQVLQWEFGSVYELPPSSHFGEVLALSRFGAVLLLAAPNDGARPNYVWDDEAGWLHEGGNGYGSGAQFFRFAPDTLGVAYTRLESDGTTSVRLQYATGPASEPLLEGITGFVTAIAKHNEYLAVGEAAHAAGAGRVQVYELDFDSGDWELAQTFVGQAGAALGRSLALDGDVLVAGAPEEGDCGAVHVYGRAGSWIDLQTIDCPSATQVNADFGDAVALDGGVLAVGAPRLDRPNPGGGIDFGGVYVYRSGLVLFDFEAFLRPAEAQAGDQFGSSLALHAWNETNVALIAGSPFADPMFDDAGSASLYLDWGAWRPAAALAIHEGPDTRFGTSVALGRHGVVVGAPRSNGNFVLDQGRAFAYDLLPLFYDGFDRGDTDAWSDVAP